MTPIVQKQYEEYFHTFATEGWELYMQTIEDHITLLKESALEECLSMEDLQTRKGELKTLNYAVTFQYTTEAMYKLLVEDQEDEGN